MSVQDSSQSEISIKPMTVKKLESEPLPNKNVAENIVEEELEKTKGEVDLSVEESAIQGGENREDDKKMREGKRTNLPQQEDHSNTGKLMKNEEGRQKSEALPVEQDTQKGEEFGTEKPSSPYLPESTAFQNDESQKAEIKGDSHNFAPYDSSYVHNGIICDGEECKAARAGKEYDLGSILDKTRFIKGIRWSCRSKGKDFCEKCYGKLSVKEKEGFESATRTIRCKYCNKNFTNRAETTIHEEGVNCKDKNNTLKELTAALEKARLTSYDAKKLFKVVGLKLPTLILSEDDNEELLTKLLIEAGMKKGHAARMKRQLLAAKGQIGQEFLDIWLRIFEAAGGSDDEEVGPTDFKTVLASMTAKASKAVFAGYFSKMVEQMYVRPWIDEAHMSVDGFMPPFPFQ